MFRETEAIRNIFKSSNLNFLLESVDAVAAAAAAAAATTVAAEYWNLAEFHNLISRHFGERIHFYVLRVQIAKGNLSNYAYL